MAFENYSSRWNEWISRDDTLCLDSRVDARSAILGDENLVWTKQVWVGNDSKYAVALGQCGLANIVCVMNPCTHELPSRPYRQLAFPRWNIIASRVRALSTPSQAIELTNLQLQPLSNTLVQVTGVHEMDQCVVVIW